MTGSTFRACPPMALSSLEPWSPGASGQGCKQQPRRKASCHSDFSGVPGGCSCYGDLIKGPDGILEKPSSPLLSPPWST